jgi:Polyketide cyclase / dehydrase and lipid transport
LRPFTFDRTFTFDVGPDELWAVLTRTGEFRRWWPWLREFSGDGLVPGGRSTCVVRAPIPYTLRFSVTVREVVAERLVDAVVDGDLAGPARLEVDPAGRGRSTARLAWEMELRRPVLRAAARPGRPVMEWGHDWVVTTGVEQFLRRALRVGVRYDRDSD